jgi:hypothetical protein
MHRADGKRMEVGARMGERGMHGIAAQRHGVATQTRTLTGLGHSNTH